jgi:2-oxoglutarate dehydrogenase complex dehydrogenase (E1) component-like enzyme
MEIFLSGMANGIEAANIEFVSENLKPIFCSPIALNFDNINDVLKKEYSAKNMDWKPDFTVRSVLLVGLKKMFPCQ